MYPQKVPHLRCPECAPLGALSVHALDTAPDGELLAAALTCEDCGRWYRIEDGIADLVRDGLREVEQDRAFLSAHRSHLPASIHDTGIPFGLNDEMPQPTDADQRIIAEGRHWGRFMRRFWDVGDRSIFDIRVKGTHPSFLVKGVLEPDDRDHDRAWGNFPARTGEMLFLGMDRFAGKLGVDVGCGGGQFGLEAARRGVRMFGFDPSFEEVWLARRHARETGESRIDYLRAEPAHPPFAPGIFALLMAKDALHHVPDLDSVFPRLIDLLEPGAYTIIHEHTDHALLKTRLMAPVWPRAIRKVRSRYPTVEVPDELLRDSANEDVSAHLIRPLLAKHFERVQSREDLFLAAEIEMIAHYAYGKRRWVTALGRAKGVVAELTLLALGDRQHFSFIGRLRP